MLHNKRTQLYLLSAFFMFGSISCSSLHSLIQSRNVSKVSTYLSEKHPSALADFDGDCKSPLMVAVETDQPEIVKLLLEKGADPNLRAPSCFVEDSYMPLLSGYHLGQTALYYAKSIGVAKLLLQAKADINLGKTIIYGNYIRTASHQPPLINAIKEGNLPLVEFLIQNKANVHLYGAGLRNSFITSNEIYNDSDPSIFVGIKNALFRAGAKVKYVLSAAELEKTKFKVYTKYKHIPTGEIFELKSFALEGNPMILTWKNRPVILPLGERSPLIEYHLIEFEWVESGENIFQWYAREANRENMIGQ